MTACAVTVVVSVTLLKVDGAKPLVAVTINVLVVELTAVLGTVATATKRNTPSCARAVLDVMGVVLSATPSPLASA